jgi:hypothetical protein
VTAFEELRAVPLFEGLTTRSCGGSRGGFGEARAGGRDQRPRGRARRHLYVILEGDLRITKQVDGGEVVINTYTPARSSPRCRCSRDAVSWRRDARSQTAGCS